MAKIVNGSIVLDPNDYIKFRDSQDNEHHIFWDDVLDRFLIDEDLEADHFIGATGAAVMDRNPQPYDYDYEVPTIWINSITRVPYILVRKISGNAIWEEIGGGNGGSTLDTRLTVNDGASPVDTDPFDVWITIDPV